MFTLGKRCRKIIVQALDMDGIGVAAMLLVEGRVGTINTNLWPMNMREMISTKDFR